MVFSDRNFGEGEKVKSEDGWQEIEMYPNAY